MGDIKKIEDQIRRAFEGPAWHGPSVKQVLANVTVPMATARPIPKGHTIWELAMHILAWQNHVINCLQRSTVSLTAEQDWPTTPAQPSQEQWNQLLEELDVSQQNLVRLISSWSESDLEKNIPGKEYSKYFLLNGLIQHNLFHAGQISILKK